MTEHRDECDDGGVERDEGDEGAAKCDEGDDVTTHHEVSPDDEVSPWWTATLEEMELVATDRRDAGWEVLALRSRETFSEQPASGDQEQFGLAYTLSANEADQLEELLETTTIDEFEAYRRTVDTTCFLLVELRDTDTERCVLVVGAYDVDAAEALASHAADVGDLFTRFQRDDGSAIASVRHDAYEKLLPPSLTE